LPERIDAMTTKKRADSAAAERIDGAWLRRWRERTGLTADQAAEKLGFAHRNSIVKFESGERPIDKRLELACRWIEANL
jgi:transcriptional regulator with XRE-family HTH domain